MFWGHDWVWGLPVIIFTIAFHICAFVVMQRAVVRHMAHGPHGSGARVLAITFIALGAIALHVSEALIWTFLYVRLDAVPDVNDAVLYSLSAITAFGHAPVFLERHWQLLGAMEAMNGVILFGLTTAFLFAAVDALRPDRSG